MTLRAVAVVRGRLKTVRTSGDQGSVLAIALAFLMVFGVYVSIVLQFSATGLRTTAAVRDVATNASAGGGALDGAINAMRSAATSGVAPAAAFPCFTLPVNELGNATPVGVTCEPRATSGAAVSGTASQPGNAVMAVSTTAAEGVTMLSGRTSLRGGARVNRRLTVPTNTTLDSSGYPVQAGQCLLTGTGTVLDSCTVGGAATDPNYQGPDVAAPPLPPALPACGSGTTLTLRPGIYRSRAALQTALDCASATTIVLSTGTYYFDFNLAGSHALSFAGGATRRIIGGTPLGTSCDPGLPGVDLVFGGDSQLSVTSGQVRLCALEPVSTTEQHIVLRGLKAATDVATQGNVAGATATSVGATPWSAPATNGAFPNGATTTATIAASSNAVLRVALPAAVVPPDAKNLSATITVRESVNAGPAATTTATLRDPAGVNVAGAVNLPLTTCSSPATPCTGGSPRDDTTASIPSISVAQLNGPGATRATIDVTLSKPGGPDATGVIDGVTLDLSYQLPIRPVCRLASPTAGCQAPWAAPTTPMFSTAAVAYTAAPLALHGTIYAPTASVDLRLTGVDETVVDRGIVVRHLVLAMTRAAGAPPPMITVPDLALGPRRVVMIATDGTGQRLARADVTFANAAGTGNGDIPKVLEWSVG